MPPHRQISPSRTPDTGLGIIVDKFTQLLYNPFRVHWEGGRFRTAGRIVIRVSTKGRYALRAMVDLANHDNDQPVARRDIAERQGISADYVAQLFGLLQDAGLVEGVKGPGGGYRLTRQAESIRVRDVVEAVEGPLALAPCVEECEDPPCPKKSSCPTRHLWERLSRRMNEVLEAYTLADLSAPAHSPEPG